MNKFFNKKIVIGFMVSIFIIAAVIFFIKFPVIIKFSIKTPAPFYDSGKIAELENGIEQIINQPINFIKVCYDIPPGAIMPAMPGINCVYEADSKVKNYIEAKKLKTELKKEFPVLNIYLKWFKEKEI